jgi:hypothetical protein
MKKYLLVAAAIALLAAGSLHAQANVITTVSGNPSALSNVGSWYYSPAYSQWRGFTETAISVTGSSTTVVLGPSVITLPDGRIVHPFGASDSALVPITFDMGSTAETITPTAVSVTTCPTNGDFSPPAQCVTFTGTFTNTHGVHSYVGSGTQGVAEAIADAGSNGGGDVYFQIDCGTVTLNTGAATTTPGGSCQVPTTFTNLGGSSLVKTTVTTAANYSLGISGSTTSFINACTQLTAGQSCGGFVTSPTRVGAGSTALTNVLITANATPGAGALHIKVWGYTSVQTLN